VWLPMKPAPPVTRTVSIDQLRFQRPLNEIITGEGGFCVSTVSIVCTHASEVAPSGLIAPTVLTMLTIPRQQPCCIDDAEGDHPPPFTRYPSFCPSSQSIPTALERLGPKALILIIRAPDRPSRPKASSRSSMRRNVCARRSRPARAHGFFAPGGLMDVSCRALSAHRCNRSKR
jgi:hypothetical protein